MPKRNSPSLLQSRILILGGLVLLAAIVLLAKLYYVQVVHGPQYADALKNQTTVGVIIPPARGSILDRNGMPLAENRASYDIDIYLRELVGHYARAHKGVLPKIDITIGRGVNKRTRREIDVARIVNETAVDIFKTLNIKPSYTDQDIRDHYNQKPNYPFTLVHNLDAKTLAQFCEKNFQIPGIEQTVRPVRYYPYGALAPHLIGYLGHPQEQTADDYQPEYVGKEGIEKSFDAYLQGTPGSKVLRKNNLGFVFDEEEVIEPKAGKYVYLTIDARIQWIVEQALRKVGRGAAVVVDVSTGDILAMVSVPNFDPNAFVPAISQAQFNSFLRDATKPLFNRSLSSYAAGSVYKPYVALAALEKKVITPSTIIYSPGAIWLANRWWKDWSPTGQGSINLRRAMAMSCNTYFYQLGERMGAEPIVSMGERLGFGQLALSTEDQPILYGERAGVLPGPAWMETRMARRKEEWRRQVEEAQKKGEPRPRPPILERWSLGHTLNTSIGQGFVEVTPLQMAIAINAIVNGGTVYYPRLVIGVGADKLDEEGHPMDGSIEIVKEFPVRVRSHLEMNPQLIAAVRDSLRAVVEEGTGRQAAIASEKVAGKTGTAQFVTTLHGQRVKDLRAWFTGFAPYDNPRYALAVIVEGGTSGGSTAAPIASEIFEAIFKMEHALEGGTSLQMTYLQPAVGHFAGVREVAAQDPGSLVGQPPDQVEPEDEPDQEARPRRSSFWEMLGFGRRSDRARKPRNRR